MAVTEHIIKSREDSFTCECGSEQFHGPYDFVIPSGETVPTCTCASCGRYHLLRRAKEDPDA